MRGLASRTDLEGEGFVGFLAPAELRAQLDQVPQLPGVYGVLWADQKRPAFTAVGTGGWFKGNNPNVGIDLLLESWVVTSSVLYFGKAGLGKSGKRGLRKRLKEYLDFGDGRAIGHRGGRYIWQIENSEHLVFCWKVQPLRPEALEHELLEAFVAQHRTLPFANLRH